MPSPSAPSLREDGSFAGKSTVPFDTEIFQHVAPPGSQDQPPPDGRIYGPGPRVPMLVLSPGAAAAGSIRRSSITPRCCNSPEKRFQVHEPNISARRRAVCGDLTSAFNFVDPNGEALPNLPATSRHAADGLRQRQNSCRRYRCHRLSTSVCPTNVARRALPARCPTSCTSRPPSRPNSAA